MATPRPLFDFGDPSRSGGFTPTGEAPGGRPRCRATVEGGVLRFEGEVALDDGSLAAIRSAPAPLDLSGAAGVALRVRGDGSRYAVELRTDDALDDVTWQATFDTATGGWEIVLLPLDLFTPVLRGRPSPQAGRLRPDRVRSVGLRLAGGRTGPFRLEVSSMAGYAADHGVVNLPRPAHP